MTPLRDTENLRTLAQMKARDPVDAALQAIACLSASQRAQLQMRFNAVFAHATPPLSLTIEAPT